MKKIEKIEFKLKGEYIELIKLLKLLQIAESGGQSQLFVEEGEVMVNDTIEHRKRAKLRTGDVVRIFNFEIMIQ